MVDTYDLQRFVDAQNPVYERVLAELRSGEKRSHWMWFVFPQLKGLGFSSMAERYGIASLAEARAYLKHETLGPRLRECTQLVMNVEGRHIRRIFDDPDDLKFRSSMTLFGKASEEKIFELALDKYYSGKPDESTLELLSGGR